MNPKIPDMARASRVFLFLSRRVQKHKRVAKPLMVALSIIMIDETRRRPGAPVLSSFVFLDRTRNSNWPNLEFIQRSFTEETKMTPQTVQYKELSESGNHDREFGPV